MLVIWDIHINHRYQHDIITTLKTTIAKFPDEEHIIFLWDYVYHFSYDREALLGLYQFWIELFQQGKKLYILAGNHDWIGNSFVYEEAQKAFEIISQTPTNKGKIEFITKPQITIIEGEKILFFPFSLEYEQVDVSLFAENYPKIYNEITILQSKKQKNFQLSADANALLLKYIAENADLLVIHHHYFDGVKFPWEKSQFSFKNIALSRYFLELSDIHYMSGHLHQTFCFKNYLCAGSIRNTSSLETNQIKGIYRYTAQQWDFHPLWINPNFSYVLQWEEQLERKKIDSLIATMRNDLENNLNSQQNFGTIAIHKDTAIQRKKTSIFITSWKIDYEKIDQYIHPSFRQELKEVKLKKSKFQSLDIKNLATLYDRKNMNSFSDWKSLLKDFLKNRYGGDYDQYENFLVHHKIL